MTKTTEHSQHLDPQQAIYYQVRCLDLAAHLFEVRCRIPKPSPKGQQLSLPAWIPGSYMVRDFAKNIVQIQAASAGQPVALTKLDKSRWRAAPCASALELSYQVYAWDPSIRAAQLDQQWGFFNGTSLFLQAINEDPETPEPACIMELIAPDHPQCQDWRVATAMTELEAPRYGFGSYWSKDYDELIDHPVILGAFDLGYFEACGLQHELVLIGKHYADIERICQDLAPICSYQINLFGAPAPMRRYLFLTIVVEDGYGGLEHRESTALICNRRDLPGPNSEARINDDYRNFLGLCSHEYFHSWNVKRIKPQGFVPYDLSNESYTQQLWAYEGITSYYDDLSLYRAGVISAESYLELLSQKITRVMRNPGRKRQSVTESSFEAWTKFYKQDENAANAIVSYYSKGALVALCVDLCLRQQSNQQQSLDKLMRLLWQEYGTQANTPGARGTAETAIEQHLLELLEDENARQQLNNLLQTALYSTAELPVTELLSQQGVEVKTRCAESNQDQGGKPSNPAVKPSLGAKYKSDSAGLLLTQVVHGGAAHQAGLSAGDLLIALDGMQLDGKRLHQLLEQFKQGDKIKLHAFRRHQLMEFALPICPAPEDTAYLLIQNRARAETWLKG